MTIRIGEDLMDRTLSIEMLLRGDGDGYSISVPNPNELKAKSQELSAKG